MENKRLDIVYCPEDLRGIKDDYRVFLGGAIQGSEEWQFNVPVIPGVTWICPRRLKYSNFDYNEQVSWEHLGMLVSNIILFWIPSPAEVIPGRSYAQTTRFELGECIGRDRHVIVGCSPDIPGRRYFSLKHRGTVHETLEDCISELISYIGNRSPKTFYTSDTHFGHQRTLDLSRRPFKNIKEMNEVMIDRWNNIVGPKDVVYHLGDFGDSWPIEYLSGDIRLVLGNYERENKSPIPSGCTIIDPGEYNNYILCHEPTKGLEIRGEREDIPILFGHIHGRQKLKSWLGMDVGVDSNNYSPVSSEEVDFFLNAIKKGYYDSDVWC